MTPEEARRIDAEEFAADCARVRQLALARINERNAADRHRHACLVAGKPFEPTEPRKPIMSPSWRPTKRPPRGKRYAFDGKELTLAEWSQIVGLPTRTLQMRLTAYGWTIERALTQPLQVHPTRQQ